jgi:hypothetical protein
LLGFLITFVNNIHFNLVVMFLFLVNQSSVVNLINSFNYKQGNGWKNGTRQCDTWRNVGGQPITWKLEFDEYGLGSGERRHDIQHNDTQQNNIKHKDT